MVVITAIIITVMSRKNKCAILNVIKRKTYWGGFGKVSKIRVYGAWSEPRCLKMEKSVSVGWK